MGPHWDKQALEVAVYQVQVQVQDQVQVGVGVGPPLESVLSVCPC